MQKTTENVTAATETMSLETGANSTAYNSAVRQTNSMEFPRTRGLRLRAPNGMGLMRVTRGGLSVTAGGTFKHRSCTAFCHCNNDARNMRMSHEELGKFLFFAYAWAKISALTLV
jgi:hypothetical protein